jgi:hypothetical protein
MKVLHVFHGVGHRNFPVKLLTDTVPGFLAAMSTASAVSASLLPVDYAALAAARVEGVVACSSAFTSACEAARSQVDQRLTDSDD